MTARKKAPVRKTRSGRAGTLTITQEGSDWARIGNRRIETTWAQNSLLEEHGGKVTVKLAKTGWEYMDAYGLTLPPYAFNGEDDHDNLDDYLVVHVGKVDGSLEKLTLCRDGVRLICAKLGVRKPKYGEILWLNVS